MSNKKVFVGSLAVNIILVLLTEPSMAFINRGKFNSLESGLFEPLFYFSLLLTISSLVLMFFSKKIFKLWLKKFMVWFIPLSLVMIAIGAEEINFGWPTRTDMAVNMGVIMVVVTIIFAFVQRFYFKVK